MPRVLEVNDLVTRFYTPEGVVHAVNGVSFHLEEGETLGIVGESGCGKSVSVLSILRLIPEPPGRVERGEAIFMGKNLLALPKSELRLIRGSQIAMIFQDPMTSLNPVMTIGKQVMEPIIEHLGMTETQGRNRVIELLGMVGIPQASISRATRPPVWWQTGQTGTIKANVTLSSTMAAAMLGAISSATLSARVW